VTKRGKTTAKVVPIDFHCAGLIGIMRDKIEIQGQVLSTGIRWNAEIIRDKRRRIPGGLHRTIE
jgi:hypothetical protein